MGKMYDEKKPAIRITSNINDFEGDTAKWKDSFYQLWRYQMTWSFAYEIAVRESTRGGVFVDLLVKPSYKGSIVSTMEDLGYRNIKEGTEYIGEVWAYEHGDLDGIEALILEY